MSSISFSAHGRCARATYCEPITTGSVGLSVSFAFDAAWSGLQKTAIFRGSGMAVDLVLSGDAATVPPEVLTIPGGDLRVGVWGADPDGNVIIPTVWATVGEIVPGAAPSGFDPDPPTPSWAAQVQEIAQDALDTANSVREDADAGAFDGATYTPAVSAGGDLSWTNDKDKPNPPTVNIKGPEGQPGQTGATPDISIGTVETLPPGSPATATITGTAENPVLSFGIPQGQQGAPGEVTQAEFDALADEVSRQKSAFDAHEQYAEETYAKQDGTYEDLTAGNAYELLSDRGDTNAQPYLFRRTGGDSSAYNREQLKKIVGGTVAFNQLVQNGNFADGRTGWSFNNCTPSVSGNKVTVSVTSGTKAVNFGLETAKKITQAGGHKYLFGFNLMVSDVSPGYARYNVVGSSYPSVVLTAGVDKRIEGIISGIDGVNRFFVYPWGTTSVTLTGNETVEAHDYIMIDLTQMFGTAIADYIYSLEQATAGAGVAFFRSLFPADYYEYNPGELVSVEGVSAHETAGFNQWDEEWEPGAVNTSDGTERTTSNTIRSKNYCGLIGGSTYYTTCGKTDGGNQNRYYIGIIFYDAEKHYISGGYFNNLTFTAPENARYFKLTTNTSTVVYGNVYNHDICINLSDPARNGTYEPYKKRTYPLDSSLTLRGIPKLDSSNRLYYDGDEYEPDGTVTRRYGVVDLGTLNWVYVSDSVTNFRSYENLGAKPATDAAAMPNALCKAMPVIDYTTMSQGTEGVTIIFAQSAQAGRIWARNTSYTDAAAFKAAMSGVMLVYELATPTTETAEPYRELEICDRDGTEEFVSTSIVPVGHETFYPVNVFDYIDQKIAALAAQIVNS